MNMFDAHSMPRVAAVVAAAGRSTRMGTPKQLLPWGETTVLEAVIGNLLRAGAIPVVCVVGHARAEVSARAEAAGADVVYNPDYAAAEMLISYQTGVRHVQETYPHVGGVLLALGDQPHIPVPVIRQVHQHALCRPQAIVIPSYAMRRGHPIYLPAHAWPFLLGLAREATLRELMHHYAARIEHVTVAGEAVLRDMDTPEEYRRLAQAQDAAA